MDNKLNQAETLVESGYTFYRAGRYEQALASFEAAAAVYQEAGDTAVWAEMLNNIGVISRLQGNRQAALAALQQAERAFAALGDAVRRGQALGNWGDLLAAAGDREEAAQKYSTAAELFAQAGDRQRQALVLRAFSLMRLRQLRFWEAMGLMSRSLQVRPRKGVGQHLLHALLRLVMRLSGGI